MLLEPTVRITPRERVLRPMDMGIEFGNIMAGSQLGNLPALEQYSPPVRAAAAVVGMGASGLASVASFASIGRVKAPVWKVGLGIGGVIGAIGAVCSLIRLFQALSASPAGVQRDIRTPSGEV